MHVQGVGAVAFRIHGSKSLHGAASHARTVILPDVLYVENASLNVIGVAALREYGCSVRFGEPSAVRDYLTWPGAQHGDVSLIQEMQYVNALPYITVSGVSDDVSAACTVPAMHTFVEYHKMKGHVGVDKMKEWHRLGCVPKEALHGAEGHACTSCTVTNARKTSYGTVAPDHRARFPNHVFHADLLHVSVPDRQGHLYVLTILDERTRYAFIHLLQKKNDALPRLKATLNRARVIHDRPVVFLRTDLGGEFGGHARSQLEADAGLSGQLVPAGCHQSNGMVERFNVTLMDSIRSTTHAGELPSQLWGDVALHVVHVYNISPHTFLMDNPLDECTVPHMAYMQDTLVRLRALVKALVPCGTPCVVVKTVSHLGKTEDRGIPGVVLGSCDASAQYRVLVNLPDAPKRVQVHRHVIIQPDAMRSVLKRDTLPDVATLHTLSAQHVRIPGLEHMFHDGHDTTVAVVQPVAVAAPSHPLNGGGQVTRVQHFRECDTQPTGDNAAEKCVGAFTGHTDAPTHLQYADGAQVEPPARFMGMRLEGHVTASPTRAKKVRFEAVPRVMERPTEDNPGGPGPQH